MESTQKFKTVISSEHKLLDLHLKETFQYRDLIYLFVKRDFTALYKQTILGPLWAIIQPLFTTIVYTIVFGNLAKLTTTDVVGDYMLPSFLFYMSGNICWDYFSSTMSSISNTFINNKGIMGKVYYPRLVTPISAALSRLISFTIQLAMLLLVIAFYAVKDGTSIKITPMLFLLPLLIVQMIILAIGFGIIVAAVTTKYRDLVLAVGFGLGLWRYGCPIAYGLSLVPTRYLNIYMLNPVTPIVTTFRYALFGFGYFNMMQYIVSWLITILVFLTGVILFSRIERTFMDTI